MNEIDLLEHVCLKKRIIGFNLDDYIKYCLAYSNV